MSTYTSKTFSAMTSVTMIKYKTHICSQDFTSYRNNVRKIHPRLASSSAYPKKHLTERLTKGSAAEVLQIAPGTAKRDSANAIT